MDQDQFRSPAFEALRQARSKSSVPGPVIVFEPVAQRSGPLWRALQVAKLALMVWGGVSLAGTAGAGVAYLQGGFDKDSPAVQATPVKLAAIAPAPLQSATQVAPAKPLRIAPAQKAAPSAQKDPSVPQGTPSVPQGAKIIQLGASKPVTQPASPVLTRSMDEPASELLSEDEFDTSTALAARLPQARPAQSDSPEITGSLNRRMQAEPAPRRFRRLRDLDLNVPYSPRRPVRAPSPFRETDAVGRHIRQVWSNFPLQGPSRHGWIEERHPR